MTDDNFHFTPSDGSISTINQETTGIWAVTGDRSRVVLAICNDHGPEVATTGSVFGRTVVSGILHMSPSIWCVGGNASLLMPFGEGLDIWDLGVVASIDLVV